MNKDFSAFQENAVVSHGGMQSYDRDKITKRLGEVRSSQIIKLDYEIVSCKSRAELLQRKLEIYLNLYRKGGNDLRQTL